MIELKFFLVDHCGADRMPPYFVREFSLGGVLS